MTNQNQEIKGKTTKTKNTQTKTRKSRQNIKPLQWRETTQTGD